MIVLGLGGLVFVAIIVLWVTAGTGDEPDDPDRWPFA